VDYALGGREAPLVVDTRGVMRSVRGPARVLGLSSSARPEECGEALDFAHAAPLARRA
jgi:hypothetical protein